MENNSINTGVNQEMTESIENALNEGLNAAAEAVNDNYTPAPVPSANVTPAATGSNKTAIVICIVAVSVVTLGIGGFIAYKVWRKKHPKKTEEDEGDEE